MFKKPLSFSQINVSRKAWLDMAATKEIRSCFSAELVTFVDDLSKIAPEDRGAYSDGQQLVDRDIGAEGGIDEMYCVLQDGSTVNLEDFYIIHHSEDDEFTLFDAMVTLVRDRQ